MSSSTSGRLVHSQWVQRAANDPNKGGTEKSTRWFPEEVEYLHALLDLFENGNLMHVKCGVSLRPFLCSVLQCQPWHISNKFNTKNGNALGSCKFPSSPVKTLSQVEAKANKKKLADLEQRILERRFKHSDEHSDAPGSPPCKGPAESRPVRTRGRSSPPASPAVDDDAQAATPTSTSDNYKRAAKRAPTGGSSKPSHKRRALSHAPAHAADDHDDAASTKQQDTSAQVAGSPARKKAAASVRRAPGRAPRASSLHVFSTASGAAAAELPAAAEERSAAAAAKASRSSSRKAAGSGSSQAPAALRSKKRASAAAAHASSAGLGSQNVESNAPALAAAAVVPPDSNPMRTGNSLPVTLPRAGSKRGGRFVAVPEHEWIAMQAAVQAMQTSFQAIGTYREENTARWASLDVFKMRVKQRLNVLERQQWSDQQLVNSDDDDDDDSPAVSSPIARRRMVQGRWI
eukprot:TRINITY_DN223_c0_g1_i6.p2 TRINITY_DN223_c0_g1~~TRINITY_DN223_c0_g1_i6.p2  ORF type:complete len:460 (-),score=76.82 TRINITY_DN223_c0_g1_i6:501-1880(-)